MIEDYTSPEEAGHAFVNSLEPYCNKSGGPYSTIYKEPEDNN